MRILVDDSLSVEPNSDEQLPYDYYKDRSSHDVENNNVASSSLLRPTMLPQPPPRVRRTGTTIAGLIVGTEYCILAADSRATMGTTVADTRAEKLHRLTPHIWAAGAGTSADLQHVTQHCCSHFRWASGQQDGTIGNSGGILYHILPREDHGKTTTMTTTTIGRRRRRRQRQRQSSSFPSMTALCHWLREQLYQSQGECQANLIVGGICPKTCQPMLRTIHPHGSMDHLVPFAALGSGGMAAMAVLEQSFLLGRFKDKPEEMTLEEAISIMIRAIQAGIENDLGSGSQIDLVILRVQKPKKKNKSSRDHEHDNDDDDNNDDTTIITTDYRRAAVPEPELPPLAHRTTTTTTTTTSSGSGSGVNGFGNTPFVLRPVSLVDKNQERRRPLPNLPQQEQQRWHDPEEEEWNKLLGISTKSTTTTTTTTTTES
ncbi:hypothetical protein ACA910_015096 [Epithemia clementina (nom. ined.)]